MMTTSASACSLGRFSREVVFKTHSIRRLIHDWHADLGPVVDSRSQRISSTADMNFVSLDREREIFGFHEELGPNLPDGMMFVGSNFDRVVNVVREQFVAPAYREPLTDHTNIKQAEEDPREHRNGSLSVGF
jgi:hypothetical protein